MSCSYCEERISDYLENALSAAERAVVESHLRSCNACSELVVGIKEVVEWGPTFPVYEPPAWLAARILVNTPHVARETWLDTLVSIGRWFVEPRIAMAIFTATLVLGWMAWETARIRSTQSATGILYVVVIVCFLGELTSQLLVEKTGYTL